MDKVANVAELFLCYATVSEHCAELPALRGELFQAAVQVGSGL